MNKRFEEKGTIKMSREYVDKYLAETQEIVNKISREEIVKSISILKTLREQQGRLFILGVGGSAANASHAVNDFRKIGGIETYAPTDNVSELTARTNDEGWETTFCEWLKTSRIQKQDAVMVFSVGGGSKTTSLNIVNALKLAKVQGSRIISIVSRNGGYAKEVSDACILIPVVDEKRITPHAEGWQGVIWHLLVNAIV
jgi:D-sedoheptulose 7-phosphate isomerase